MLKLYGQYKSRTFRVAWLLKESNIPYQHEDVTIMVEGATAKQPWYAELNPNQRVPTIDDDGFVMWESAAINLYLAEKYKSPLLPSTLEGRARAMQWGFFIANDVEVPMVTIFQNKVLFAPEKRNAALLADAEARIGAKLKVLDDHLKKHKYFGGDKWDLSDFMVASVTYTLFLMKHDLSAYPHFHQWLVASCQRPKAKEARALRGDVS